MVNNITKWILRVLAVVFAFLALTELITTIAKFLGDKHGDATLLLPTVISGLMAWGLWHWSNNADRVNNTDKSKRDLIAQETLSYFELVNTTGSFPIAPTDRIISRPDCPVLASCNARLLEVSTEKVEQYLGTRIKLAGMPIYLGQSSPKSRQVVQEAAQGELAITSKSLLFNGAQRSADVDLDKITALDIAIDGITVSVKGKQKPFIFIVPNGFLWGMLVKNLIHLKIEGRTLPAGSKLQVL
jgi:hypothetical protein